MNKMKKAMSLLLALALVFALAACGGGTSGGGTAGPRIHRSQLCGAR